LVGRQGVTKGSLSDLPTPSLLLNLPAVERNCDRMLQSASAYGMQLRAMTKTHKTIEGGILQVLGTEKIKAMSVDEIKKAIAVAPIVVSTIGEAEFYGQNGFKNILYPYPPTLDKLKRALVLMRDHHVNMQFSFDNLDVLSNFLKFWEANDIGVKIPVYIDVDPRDHRSGVIPEGPMAVQLAKKIESSKHINFHGLYCHSGFSYAATNKEEIQHASGEERDSILKVFTSLKSAGLFPENGIVAVGSTPACSRLASSMKGINEMHPGNYALYDSHQYLIGACDLEDCASTILSRVLSQYTEPIPRLLIDAGAFALSKDKGPTHIHGYNSYGLVAKHPTLIISAISQELGTIIAKDGHTFNAGDFPPGSLLQIIPNHSCMSSYCYEYFNVVDGNGNVVDQWKTCPRH